MRTAKVARKTKETDVKVELSLDGSGKFEISTGLKFFDHLLSSFSRHGRLDMNVKAQGDNEHHIVEDVAICLGEAIKKSLGEKKGIARFGHAIIPMDDVLMLTSIDLSGRSYTSLDLKLRRKHIEGLSVEMVPHFLETFASEAKLNLHVKLLEGKNDHHKVECLFKALGVAIRDASSKVGGGVPSIKGKI